MHQISFGFYSMGITPEREITRTRKKKNVHQIFFHEESIYEISKPLYAWFLTNGWMHTRTDEHTTHQLLQSWGHKKCLPTDPLSKLLGQMTANKLYFKDGLNYYPIIQEKCNRQYLSFTGYLSFNTSNYFK